MNKDKVWLAVFYDYEDTVIFGVYDSKLKAEEYNKLHIEKNGWDRNYYDTQEYEVE